MSSIFADYNPVNDSSSEVNNSNGRSSIKDFKVSVKHGPNIDANEKTILEKYKIPFR